MTRRSSARCRSCAARNPVGFTFCLACGARVRQESLWPRGPEPIWQRSYCLVWMEDQTGQPETGTGYPLDVIRRAGAALTIGSDDASDIVLDHPSVSARHAWLIRHGDGFLIEDAESEAGTFVNEEQVTRARRLHLRDAVRIGACALVYALGDDVCPHCHSADSLVAVTDPRRKRRADAIEQAVAEAAATGPAAPTHECHQCGRQFWVVASRWAGWWRRWQWRSQVLVRQLACWRRQRPMSS